MEEARQVCLCPDSESSTMWLIYLGCLGASESRNEQSNWCMNRLHLSQNARESSLRVKSDFGEVLAPATLCPLAGAGVALMMQCLPVVPIQECWKTLAYEYKRVRVRNGWFHKFRLHVHVDLDLDITSQQKSGLSLGSWSTCTSCEPMLLWLRAQTKFIFDLTKLAPLYFSNTCRNKICKAQPIILYYYSALSLSPTNIVILTMPVCVTYRSKATTNNWHRSFQLSACWRWMIRPQSLAFILCIIDPLQLCDNLRSWGPNCIVPLGKFVKDAPLVNNQCHGHI